MRLVGLITLNTCADVAIAELWLCGNGVHVRHYLREAIPKWRGVRRACHLDDKGALYAIQNKFLYGLCTRGSDGQAD